MDRIPAAGDLTEVPLPDVFRVCYLGRNSGTLELSQGVQHRRVFFVEGEVRSARSNRMEHRIGQYILRATDLTKVQLLQALGSDEAEPIGQRLVNLGLLRPLELSRHLKGLVTQIVLETFGWEEGQFQFLSDAPSVPPEEEIRVSSANLIFKGFRTHATTEMARRILGDHDEVLVPHPDPRLQFQRVTLEPEEADVLERVDGSSTAREILAAYGDDEEALSVLGGLVACGLVTHRSAVQSNRREPPVHASREDRRETESSATARKTSGDPPTRRRARAIDKVTDLGRRRPTTRRAAAGPGDGSKVAPRTKSEPATEGEAASRARSKQEIRAMRQRIERAHAMLDSVSLYQLLSLPPKATQKEIHNKYMMQCKAFHPDLALEEGLRDMRPKLLQIFDRLQEAHAVLIDPDRRKRYDKTGRTDPIAERESFFGP